jgi:uncharacterized protein (TIGR02246 family)
MKRVLWGLLLSIVATALTCRAQTTADETAVRNIPQRFSQAWEKHDGHELAKIMAVDVDFVNVGADWLQGRANFETYHTRLLSGRFKNSTLTPLKIAVRFLQPNIAVLHWSWTVQGDKNEDGTPRQQRYGLFTMIVEKQSGEWLVVVAQNTNQIPGPNPEMKDIQTPIAFP